MVLRYFMLLVYISAVMSNPCLNQQLSTVPHPHNCNTFIVCWMSQLYFQACPTGTLFDTFTKNCQPWPIAQCCNGENPNTRRPSSNSVGTLVTRVLSTVKNTFSAKLLPDDVTIQSTTATPEIKGYTLQPITITSLSHESEPRNESTLSNIIPTSSKNRDTSTASNKSMESTTSLVTSTTEINTIGSEPNSASSRLSTISATKTTLPPVTLTLATNRLTQKTIDTSLESTTIKVASITDIHSKATIPTTATSTLGTNSASASDTSEATKQTINESIKSTTPKLTSITDIHSKVTEPKTATGTQATTSTSRTTTVASEIPFVDDHTLTSAAIETTKHNLPPSFSTTPTEEPCWVCSTDTEEESAEITTANKDSEATHTLNTKIPSAVTEYYKFTTSHPLTPKHMTTENEVTESNTSRKPIETLPPVTPTFVTNGESEQTSDASVESTTAAITSITDIHSKVTEPKTATGIQATTSTNRTTTVASDIPIVDDHTLTSAAIETTKHNLPPSFPTTPTEEPCWVCSTDTEEESAETTTANKDSEATHTLNTKIPSAVTEYYKFTTNHPLTPTHMTTENEVTESNTSRKPIETLPPVTPTFVTNGESEQTTAETTTANKESEATHTLNTKIPSAVTEHYKFTTSHPLTPKHMTTENEVTESNTSRKPIETLPPVTPTFVTNGESEQTSDASVESTTSAITSITDIHSKVTEPKTATGTQATTSTSRTTTVASEIPFVDDHTLTSAAIETTKHNLPPSFPTTPTEEPCWVCSTDTEEESAEITTANKDSEATHTLNTKIPSAVTEHYKFTTSHPLTPKHMTTENEVTESNTSRKPIETLPPVTPTFVTNGESEQTSDASVESTTSAITSITDIHSKVTEPKTATGTQATTSTSRTTTVASEIPFVDDHTLTSAAIETTKHNLPPSFPTTPTEEPCWVCSTDTEEESAEITTANKDSEATHTLNTKIPSAVTEHYKFTTSHPLTPKHMTTENEVTESNTSRKPIETLPPVTPTFVTNGEIEQTSDASVELTTSAITSITDIHSKVTEPKTATGTQATTSTSRTTTVASEIPFVDDHTLTSAAIETTKHNLPPSFPTTPTEEPCWVCSTDTEEESAEITTANKDSEATHTLNTKIPSAVTEYYKFTTNHPLTPKHMTTENEVTESNTSRKPIETLPPVTPTFVTNGESEQTSDASVESTTSAITSITDIHSKVTEPKTATGTQATTSTSRTTTVASEIPFVDDHTLTSAAIETTKHNLRPSFPTTPTEEPCWVCSTDTEEESAETTTANKDSEATHTLNTKIPSAVTEYYKFTTNHPLTPKHMTTENEVTESNTSRKPIETLPPVTPTFVTNGESEQTSDASVESTTAAITSITDIHSKVTEPKTATGTQATTSTSRTTTVASEIPFVDDHTLTSAAIETTKHNLPPSFSTTPTEEPCWVCSTDTEEESAEITTANKDSEATHTLNTKIPSAVTEHYKFTTSHPLTPKHMTTENEVTESNTSRKPIETLPPVTPTFVTNGESEQTSDASVESTTSAITSITDIHSKVTEPKTATGTQATTSTSRTTTVASEIPFVDDHTLTSAAIETTKHNLPPSFPTTPTEEPCWVCSTDTEEESAETTTANKDSEATHTLNTKIPSAVTEYYKFTTNHPLTPKHMTTENEVTESNTSRKPIETLPPVTPTFVTNGESEQTSDASVESTTAAITSITDIHSKVTEPKTATGTQATTSTSRTTTVASEIPFVDDHTLTSAAIETTKHNLPPSFPTTPTEEPCWVCSTDTEEESAEITTANKDSEATHTLNTKIPSAVTEYYKFTTNHPLTPKHMTTENEVTESNTSRKPIETLPPVTPTFVTNGESEQTSDASVESTTSAITSITDIHSKVTEPKTATGTQATTSTSRTTTVASEIPFVDDHTLTSAAIETTKHNLPPSFPTTPTEEPCWVCSTDTEEESAETTTANKDSEATHTLNTKIPSAVTEYYKFTTNHPLTPKHMTTENEVTESNTSRKPIETLPPVTPTFVTNGESEQTSDASVESTTSAITSITDIHSKVTEPKTATGTQATTSTSRTTTVASEIPFVDDHTLTSAAIETTKHNLPPSFPTTPTEEPCWVCSTDTEEESAETTTANKDSEATHTLNTKIPSAVTEYYKFTTNHPLTPKHMTTENEVTESNTSRKPIETLPPVTPTFVTNGESEQTSDASVESTTSAITSITDIHSKVTEPKTATGTQATTSTSRTTTVASEIPFVDDHTLTSAAIETTKHNLPPSFPTTPTEEPCWVCSTDTEEESAETTTANKDSEATHTLNTKIPSAVTEYYKFTTNHPLTPKHMTTENEVTESNTSRKPIETLPPVTPTFVTNGESEQTSDASVESTTTTITSISDIHTKVPCPYYASQNTLTTSESPTKLQLPDCLTNDKFLYPDLQNCSFYFKCFNGVMQRMNCKPNFGFNPHLMKCVPEDSAKCGEYKSTADQKLYLVTFMLFHHIVENKQIEFNKDKVESYLR